MSALFPECVADIWGGKPESLRHSIPHLIMLSMALPLTFPFHHQGCTKRPSDWNRVGILGGHWGLHLSRTSLQDMALAFVNKPVCPIKCDGVSASSAIQQVW